MIKQTSEKRSLGIWPQFPVKIWSKNVKFGAKLDCDRSNYDDPSKRLQWKSMVALIDYEAFVEQYPLIIKVNN